MARLVGRVVPDGEAGERRVDGAVDERDGHEDHRVGHLLRGELVDADRHAPAAQFGHVQPEEQQDRDDEREHCVARRHAALEPHELLREPLANVFGGVSADLRFEEQHFGEAVVQCRCERQDGAHWADNDRKEGGSEARREDRLRAERPRDRDESLDAETHDRVAGHRVGSDPQRWDELTGCIAGLRRVHKEGPFAAPEPEP